mmetsp:Transcript_18887/g.34186  ORF Transcript_18887/g.34186 Transcript_18887/m.34186 type:complete len:203 (+) Transcript_18887:185-793(+)
MHCTTSPRSLSSYRSGVSKSDDCGTPISRQALRKKVTFSICLNARDELLIFFTEPGLITLTALQRVAPSFSCSPKPWLKASPVRPSIHACAFDSSLRSYFSCCLTARSWSMPKPTPRPPPATVVSSVWAHDSRLTDRIPSVVAGLVGKADVLLRFLLLSEHTGDRWVDHGSIGWRSGLGRRWRSIDSLFNGSGCARKRRRRH